MDAITIETTDPSHLQAKIEAFNFLLAERKGIKPFPKPLEQEFQISYNDNTRFAARLMMLLGLIFFAASSVFDVTFFSNYLASLTVRLFIITPLLLIITLFAYTRFFPRIHQYVNIVYAVITMIGLVTLAAIIPLYMKDILYQSLTLVIVFVTTLPRLLFRSTMYVSLSALLIFILGFYFSNINQPIYYYWSLFGNIYILFTAAVLCLVSSYFNESYARNEFLLTRIVRMENQLLDHMSRYDKLTNVPNRRYFDEILDKEWRRVQRHQQSMSLLFIDFDYFKQYNDTYGHQAGDDALIQVAMILNHCSRRAGDMVARYGGDEFIVIVPNESLDGAIKLAKNIMTELKNLAIPHASSMVSPFVSVTIGISAAIPTIQVSSDTLIKEADLAIQYGKKHGRNNIYVYNNGDIQVIA